MEIQLSIAQALKKLKCPLHQDQQISLICVAPKCRDNRLFCIQCFDGQQHNMLNIKKFSTLYDQHLKSNREVIRKQIQVKWLDLKNKLNTLLDEVFTNLLSKIGAGNMSFNGQQQQVRGKINHLASNNIWNSILKQKNMSDSKIQSALKQREEIMIFQVHESIKMISNDLISYIKNFLQKIQQKSKQSMLIKQKVQQINFEGQNPKYTFDLVMKHKQLIVSPDRKTISNKNKYGHYFAVTSQPLDVKDCYRDFKIRSYGPDKDASLWFGITYPYLAQKGKWQFCYEQNKGSYAMVVYNAGSIIKFWSTDNVNYVKSSQGMNIQENSVVRVCINYDKKLCQFLIGCQKKMALVYQMPIKTFAKMAIHPMVGFYGLGLIQHL